MSDDLTPAVALSSPAVAIKTGPEAEVSQSIDPAPEHKGDEGDIQKSFAEVVERAKKRFEYIEGVDADNRRNQVEDTKFAWERGAQWNEEIRRRRETAKPPRPWLEFNQTGPYIKRITNDQRQNKPAIRVHPAHDATAQQAKLYEGLIRSIEYCSDAKDIYMLALEHAATGGRGYWRIVSEYESEDSFNQVLAIKPIANPLSVYLDPDAVAPDKSDAKWGFVCEWIDQDTYEREWPGAGNAIAWDSAAKDPAEVFFDGNKVCVADYYEVIEEKVELLQLSDGRAMWADKYMAMAQSMAEQPPIPGAFAMATAPVLPPQIVKRASRSRTRVDWYKLTARTEPLAVYEWRGKYIPIVCVVGDEIDVQGRKIYQGVIRRLRDAQMMYNYWFTLATERIALAPRAPFIGASGQFEGHDEWEDLNTENHPYLEWEFVKNPDGEWYAQPPQRTEPIPVDAGLIQMLSLCAQVIRDITGQRDSETPNPNVPWRAILAEQRKGDLATFHYGDNLAKSIENTGRQIVDLIPHYYDTQRAVVLMGEDGTHQPAVLNQSVPNPATGQTQTLNNVGGGTYIVAVDVGPNYATKRLEAVADMKDFMGAMGEQTASVIGDLFAKQADWPGDIGDQVSARLFATLPPEIQALASSDNPQATAMQQAMQKMQQQFQGQMQQVQQAMQKLQSENEQVKSENLQLKAANAQVRVQAANRSAEAQADIQTQAMESQDVRERINMDWVKTLAEDRRSDREVQLKTLEVLGALYAKLGPAIAPPATMGIEHDLPGLSREVGGGAAPLNGGND